MFLVIVVCDRNLQFVKTCATHEEAVEQANKALLNWLTNGKGLKPSELDSEDVCLQICFASEFCDNAWSSYDDEGWDAYIINTNDPSSSVDIFAE